MAEQSAITPVYDPFGPQHQPWDEFFAPEIDTLRRYSQITHDERASVHPNRVAKIVYDFCGSRFGEKLIRSAFISDLVTRADDPIDGTNALKALKTLSVLHGEDSVVWHDAAALATDTPEIEGWLSAARAKAAKTESDPHVSEVLTTSEDVSVRSSAWRVFGPTQTRKSIFSLFDTVNVESIFGVSAEMIDKLRQTSGKDRKIYQDVIDAETLARLCKIGGYDGMSMALDDAAKKTRLQKLGVEQVLAEAKEELDKYKDIDTQEFISRAYSELLGGYDVIEPSVTDYAGHGISIGEATIDRDDTEADIDVKWRKKTLGSTAWKIFKKGRMPTDIFAMTLVVENQEQLQDVFASLVMNIDSSESTEYARKPRGEKPIYVRGNQEYIDGVEQAFAAVDKDPDRIEADVNDHKREFRAAKVMVVFDGVPLEIMVQTRKDRERARLGKRAAHGGYKAGNCAGESLKKLKERINQENGGVIDISSERGKRLMARVALSEQLPDDWMRMGSY